MCVFVAFRWAGDIAQLVKWLPGMRRPEFDSQRPIKLGMTVPACHLSVKDAGAGAQGHLPVQRQPILHVAWDSPCIAQATLEFIAIPSSRTTDMYHHHIQLKHFSVLFLRRGLMYPRVSDSLNNHG